MISPLLRLSSSRDTSSDGTRYPSITTCPPTLPSMLGSASQRAERRSAEALVADEAGEEEEEEKQGPGAEDCEDRIADTDATN